MKEGSLARLSGTFPPTAYLRAVPLTKAATLTSNPQLGARRTLRAALSILCSLLLTVLALPLTALAADTDAELTIEQYITDHQDQVPTFHPGDRFSFTVNLQCSSTETGTCLAAKLIDDLPEPLAFDDSPMSITPNIATASVSARTLTVKFNGDGLEAGVLATVTVNVLVPTTSSGDFDGRTIRNTATISAGNADSVSDTAAFKLSIPTKLAAHATKSATPGQTIPALAGRTATFTIGGTNDSNVSVDSLQLTDPVDTAHSAFDYLAVTGLTDLEMPDAATRVQLDWFDGTDWHAGTAVTPPNDPDALLPSDRAAVKGLRTTFTGAAAKAIAPGATAKLTIRTVSRDAFDALGADQSLDVSNTVRATVSLDADSATDQASASITFQKQPVKVAVSKTYATDQLVSGKSTTATVTATNGVIPVSRFEVSEPASGHDDLVAQGLAFGGFVTDPQAPRQLTWPSGTTHAEITYRYTDGGPQTLGTDTADTLPDPDPDPTRTVTGFTIVFTAPGDGIDSRAKATVPFLVTAGPVAQEAGVAADNTVRAEVTSSTPDTGADTATAELTLLPQRVRTSTTKTFTRDTIWATPGTTNTVSITGRVSQSSTVGAEYLQVNDIDAGFWDYFDLRRIHSTDIPANANLTVSYFDGNAWLPLAGPVAGPVPDWSFSPTDAQRAAITGLRFAFTPKTAGTLLPVGFTVAPRFDVTLRRALRSDSAVATTGGATPTVVSDTAATEVGNAVAIQPVVSASTTAVTTLRPTAGAGGDGTLWLVTKRWIDPIGGDQVDATNISALTDDTRTAVLGWGTDGLSLSSLQVVDDPGYASPSTSFYDAFDLVGIRPITTATDPQIGKDRVSAVELYSSAANGWVDVTGQACGSGSACDGGFPGYTLTDAQRATTLAVRLTFAPGSASQTGAVALSSSASRQIRFDYQLRRTLRSDAAHYALGDTHSYSYNSGHAGTVNNHVRATGTLTEPDEQGNTTVTTSDTAGISILDQPLNVSLTKTLDQTHLGLPQLETTAAGDYPLVRTTLVATNNTASRVPELTIADPSPATTGLGAYDRLNLYQLQFTALPDDLSATDVTISLAMADGSTQEHSYAEAVALTPAQLADVVGVTVRYGAEANLADPARALIATGASATVVLTYQLRSHLRGDPAMLVADQDVVTNTARVELHSPGGISCTGGAGCDEPSADDAGSLTIVQPTYTVSLDKSLNWASRYEDQSASGYVVTLAAQPDGTARTKQLTVTDAAPTFWNAFDLAGLPAVTLPAPITDLRLSVLTGVTYDASGGQLTALCSGSTDLTACWHAGDWTSASVDGQVHLVLPAGTSFSGVRGVQVEAQHRENGQVLQWERPADPTLVLRLNATRRATLVYGVSGASDTPVPTTRKGQPTAPGETSPGVFSDTATATGVAGWMNNTAPYTDTATDSASTTLKHRVNMVLVEKTPGQGAGSQAPHYDLDATIGYQLKVTNTGTWAMTGLQVADHIDLVGGSSPLVAADIAAPFTVKVNGIVATGFTVALDANTGDLSVDVPAGFTLAPGSVLLVTTNLRFRDRLDRGTVVTNNVRVSSDRPFEKCDYTTDAKAQASLADVAECAASTTVVTAASTPMTVSKSVKGDGAGAVGATPGDPNYDDLGVMAVGATDAVACQQPNADGFYSYPCTPITRPGGTETWQLALASKGNVAANMISSIDVLPAPGDTGVTVGTSRKSKFAPLLLGNVQLDLPTSAAAHHLRTFYTTTVFGASCNKADILNDTKPAGQDNCGIDWHEFTAGTDADTLATAKAVKFLLTFDDPAEGLAPGERLSLRFDTRTPTSAAVADPTTTDPIAWNSAAIGSRTADSATFPARSSLVTEPRKAGIALASGQLDLTKIVVAPSGAAWLNLLPASYEATLACTSGGQRVDLRGSTSSVDASVVSLAADGTSLAYNGTGAVNLPLGADCAITETSVPGAEVSYSAPSAVADRTYVEVPNVAHPHSGGQPGTLAVTNTYRNAGFTVTKDVTGPMAKDAAGQPVRFKDYTFATSCTFVGTEVVPTADATFSLRAGQSRPFTGLPAGADCTVTETYAAGAAGTSIAVTQDARTTTADADTATFGLVAGDATVTGVAVTNSYTTGAVTITKALGGAGASLWADQVFEAELTCTSSDADPGVVYTARHTLTRIDTTWTVTDLATGARCTVTEPRTGGANASSVTGGTFTVGSNPVEPAMVTITNTFASGSVLVSKRVLANGQNTASSPWADGSYPVTLACTRQVDGTSTPVAIPGGATRQLTAASHWAVTFDGLPAGASCAASEGTVALSPAQPDPVVTITDPVTVGDATTSQITVSNDFPAGKLVITKALAGAGTSFFSAASFDVSCTLAGYPTAVFTRTGVTLTAAALTSAPLGPIPFGAECTVHETDNGGADATPADQVRTISPNPVTADVTTVGFTNSFSAGTVTITKTLTGPAAAEAWATAPTFAIAVKCGLAAAGPYSYNATVNVRGGQSADLKDAGGNSRLFPIGTHCWATETGTAGAVTSVVDHDTFANAVVVAAAPGSVQRLSITATNGYTYAGFTVTKTVVTSGATDQDGTILVYSPTFTFTASCLFNGNEVVKLADRTFTLTKQGDGSWSSKAFDHLPTGASCSITETGKAGATTTQVQVTQNAVAGTKTTAAATTFTLAEGDASTTTAAFTNTYGIGTLRVVKVLSPVNATWATAPFTLHVACTAAGFITGTVFAKDFTVSKGSLTIPDITNLPTGASCTTTEATSANGGANTSPITNGTVAINTGIVTTTVTNTFRTGSVKVTKALQVNGVATTAQPWVGGSYTMTLHCTRTVNGSPETLDLTKLAVSATQVLNSANSFSYTWAGLPQAATCWATEDAIGYPVGTPSQPQPTTTTLDVPTVPVGNGTTVAQKVTNNFAYGGVQIVKQLTGEAAAAYASGTFSFDTSCTLAGSGTVFTRTGTALKRSGSESTLTSAVIGPIPQGGICTVTETATAGATSVTPASRSVTLDAIAAGSNQTATFSNDFRYGGFTVTKNVDDGGAVDASGVPVPYAGSYAFTASCLFNGAEVVPLADRSFNLTRQGTGTWSSKAFSQLPSGASCTVTETGTAGAPRTSVTVAQGASTLLDTDATSTGAFTLATGDATATTVGFTNHYTTGGLDITKQLAGAGAAAWGTGTFTVALACTLDNDAFAGTAAISVHTATHQLTDGQTWTVRNLPTGATCAVSEPKAAGANATAFANGTPTITAANQTVTVTNTFNTGTVRVTKVLKVNGVVTSAQPWASGGYTMQLSCTKDFDNDGTAEALTLSGPTRTISGGGSATWTGLPEGATCAVAETGIAYPDGTPSQPVPSSTTYSTGVTVANTATADLTVTNDFAYGSVRISKGITGPAAATYGSGAFTFDLACSLDGTTGTVFSRTGITLQRSGSETTLDSGDIGPIPQGAVCTVTETGTGGASVVFPASRTDVLDPVVAGASRTASFDNDFQFAGFTVAKTVDNGGALDASGVAVPYAGAYSFTASCRFNGGEVVPLADRTFTLTGGGSKPFTGLPTGASCTIVETGTAGSPRTSVKVTQGASTLVDTDATTTGTFTLAAGDATGTAVGFTNHYTTGGLDITKQVAGAGAALWGGGTFTIGLVCTLDNDANAGTSAITVYNGTHTLTKTQTWAVRNLPTGSACTVSEPKKAGANSSSISLATPTITAANQAVTVTNTFTVGFVKVTKVLRANGAATSAQPWTGGSYPVTIGCTKDFDNDGTAEALTISGATQTITGAGTYTWNNLPQGASCTVTEGTSVVVSQPQPTPSVSANVTVQGTTQNLTLTNSFTAGKLVVHKDITGDGSAWGTGPFVFSVSCTLAGVGTVFTTSVTLTPAVGQTSLDSAVLGPIPVASVCTVTETTTAGATTVTTPDPVTIALNPATGNVTTVAFANEFRNAGFTVTKNVQTGQALDATGAAISYRAAGFTASCMFKGVEVVPLVDRSFTIAAGASRQFAGLPTGATCKVTESDTAGAASTATAITQGGSPVADTDAGALVAGFALTSGDATATTVAFANTYTTGSTLITKALAGSGAALWADPQFTVRLVCTLASATGTTVYDGTHQLTVADPWRVNHLPTGASCTVTEPAAGAANATSFTNQAFTVGTAETAVTVRNTYTAGAVRVSKHLTVDGAPTAAAPWTAGSYTVALSCTRLVNGVATPIAVPGGAGRTITGGGTADFSDLPTGATCTLAETGSSPASQRATISPATVTIGADPASPQAFGVTNDFHTAALTIRKQLAGAGADSFGDGPFRFDTTCTLAGAGEVLHATTTLSRPAGSTLGTLASDPLGPVPVGAVCVITEAASGGADVVPDPVTLTIAEDAAANLATFTNQFSAGTVWLTKQLGGAAAAEPWATGASFVIDVTCQVKVDGVAGTVFSRRVTIAGGQRVNVTDAAGLPSRVPLGSHCFATEVDAQGAGSTYTALDSYDNAAVVTAGTPAALQGLELGLTNTYEYAGFTVAKSVSNGGALDADGQSVGYHASYGFQADCTLNGVPVLSQAFELPDGGSRAFARLPAGASCAVAETEVGAAPHTSVQVTQNGTAAAAATAATTSFTLRRGWVPFFEDDPSVNQVAFANAYDTGAITVTKQVVGDGADDWGNAQFRVRLACTLDTDADAATPAVVVYDLTRTVTKADPTWAVANLPTGAYCTATETADGGATSHTGPQDVVVANQPATPTQVRLTNFFGTGAVLVTKTMTVDGVKPTTGGWADQLATSHFGVRLDCARLVNGVAEVVPVPGAAERTIDAASSWQALYTGLPVGADCSATEVSSTPIAQSVSYSLPIVTVTGAAQPAELGITNDYRTGSLIVAKQVTGPGAAFGDGPFHFAVRCALAGLGDPVFVDGLTLGAGSLTSAPLGPIPVGSDCRVTETAAGGATSAADPADVTIPDDTATANTATATLVNDFGVGSFTVTKTVDDGGALDADGHPVAYPGRYRFTVACDFDGTALSLPTQDASFALAAGENHPITGLPQGAACSVTETGSGNAALVTVQLDGRPAVAATTADLTIGEAPVTVAVTNHYRMGAATITKLVTGTGAAAWGNGPFTLHTACTLDTDADDATAPVTVFAVDHQVTRPEPDWTITNLPSGADCTVTETATGAANTPAEPATFFVGQDPAHPSPVTLVNDFSTGSVRVSKAILVGGKPSTAEPYSSATYQLKLTCTRNVDGATVYLDIPGDSAPVGDAGDGVRTVTGASSVTYTDLPTGASCAATEVAAGLALPAGQVSVDHPLVSVPASDGVDVTVTNDYHTGMLLVSKALAGAGAATYADGEFTFDVSCTLTDTSGLDHAVFSASGLSLTRAAGLDSDPLGPIPVGSSCTVTETAAGGADQPALPVTVSIADSAGNAATLTNTFTEGSLRVRLGLTLDGVTSTADPYAGGRYTTAVACTRDVNGVTVDVPVPGGASWTSVGPGERLVTGLPVGASCTVTQTAASLAPQGVSYDPTTGAGAAASIAAVVTADADRPATLTVIDDFTTSTLSVHKVLTGDGAGIHGDREFRFAVSCTLAEDGVATPHDVFSTTVTLTRAAGLDSDPLGPVPVGSECIVTETAAGGATVPSDPVTISIDANAEANIATLTNTFEVGTVTVTKRLQVDGAPTTAEPYASGTYTVRLDCTRLVVGEPVPVTIPGGSTRTITGAGSVDVTGLPLGASCQVSEPAASLAIPAAQVTISPTTVTVGAEPVSVEVTNDYRSGSLVLHWDLTGTGVIFAGPANFTVECALDGATAPVFQQDLTLVPVDGQGYVESGVLGPIPVGSICTVTQHTANGANTLAIPVNVTGTTTAVTAQLANQYSAGTLTIVKQLTGAGAGEHGDTVFTIAVTCAQSADGTPLYAGDVTITGAGSTQLLDDAGQPLLLPAGTHCWGAETGTGGALESAVDHGDFDQSVAVTADNPDTVQQLTITVTNRFGASSEALAFTGGAGWGLGFVGLMSIVIGALLVARRRPRRIS